MTLYIYLSIYISSLSWEVNSSTCKCLDLWIIRMSTCLQAKLLGSCRKDMLSGSRTPEFVAGVLPLGFSIEIPKKIQKGTLLQGQIVVWDASSPPKPMEKKRCPDPHPICTGKVTEALAKPRQASASPGFCAAFPFFCDGKNGSNMDRVGGWGIWMLQSRTQASSFSAPLQVSITRCTI